MKLALQCLGEMKALLALYCASSLFFFFRHDLSRDTEVLHMIIVISGFIAGWDEFKTNGEIAIVEDILQHAGEQVVVRLDRVA